MKTQQVGYQLLIIFLCLLIIVISAHALNSKITLLHFDETFQKCPTETILIKSNTAGMFGGYGLGSFCKPNPKPPVPAPTMSPSSIPPKTHTQCEALKDDCWIHPSNGNRYCKTN
jgi:hypothetical protein